MVTTLVVWQGPGADWQCGPCLAACPYVRPELNTKVKLKIKIKVGGGKSRKSRTLPGEFGSALASGSPRQTGPGDTAQPPTSSPSNGGMYVC